MNTRETGKIWEEKVCGYLRSRGTEILDRNFTVKGGEIDIIAREGDYICFIEVKFRTDKAVDAYQSVGYKKKSRIIKTADIYLRRYKTDLQPRFDVVFVFSGDEEESFEYIKNAYDASSYNY